MVLTLEREAADFFEEVAKGRDGKLAANWMINEFFARLNKEGMDVTTSPVSAAQLGGIVDLIASGAISGKIGKDLFEIVWAEGGDPARDRRSARHEAGHRPRHDRKDRRRDHRGQSRTRSRK
jgi:aspartyl-tRNA(Asn)/glutamyl-tRNA(Gln) amidotransferase subunit B